MHKNYTSIYILTLIALLFPLLQVHAQPPGYTYAKEITIHSSEIAGSLTNFPVLVSVTDPDLKTVGYGGHVENANGWDIIFTLTDCNTILNEQIESYSPSTGTVLIWVEIPNLPSGSDFNFFMYYGNSSISTDPSTTATWNSNYLGVWHLDENPSSSQYADVTSNVQNGTTHNMVSADQVTGIIGDAGSFNGHNAYVTLGGGPPWPKCNTPLTVSVWAYYTSVPTGNQNFLSFTSNFSSSAYQLGFRGNQPVAWKWGGGTLAKSFTAPSRNTWHYYVYTYDGTTNNYYIDGALVQSTTNATQNGTPNQGAFGVYMNGVNPGGEYYKGYMDEGRLSNTNRSAGWVKTEYNNQSNPSAFYIFSTEYSASAICSILPIKLLYFTGQAMDGYNLLRWSTASETNNNYFTLERSIDGITWTIVGTAKGAGTSSQVHDYSMNDEAPAPGTNYYRLKQTDFDGSSMYSYIISLSSKEINGIASYPNPATDILHLSVNENTNTSVRLAIYDMNGKQVYTTTAANKQIVNVNVTHFAPGIYCIVAYCNDKPVTKKVMIR